MKTPEQQARESDFIAAEDWIRSDYVKAILSLPIERVREMMFEVFRAGHATGKQEAEQRIWARCAAWFTGAPDTRLFKVTNKELKRIIFGDEKV